ncbi:hypothetical protein GCM10011588_64040 [Nocardia jinanensis]|uniref:Uncharacterized protein n=1 Tax=Nocardia jinanensis TaxID=382504 RepID=A0A917RW70_9NOCA|nr:hypothetical protein GCM10011588_64040 [Nocardia jinanensis]
MSLAEQPADDTLGRAPERDAAQAADQPTRDTETGSHQNVLVFQTGRDSAGDTSGHCCSEWPADGEPGYAHGAYRDIGAVLAEEVPYPVQEGHGLTCRWW